MERNSQKLIMPINHWIELLAFMHAFNINNIKICSNN